MGTSTAAGHARTAHKRRASALGDGGPLAEPVPIEDFPPPAWRTVLNSRADLGEYLRSHAEVMEHVLCGTSCAELTMQDTPTFTHLDQALDSPKMSSLSLSSRPALH